MRCAGQDVDVDEKYELKGEASSLPVSLFNTQGQYFEIISNKLPFDFQFLEYRHDNRK